MKGLLVPIIIVSNILVAGVGRGEESAKVQEEVPAPVKMTDRDGGLAAFDDFDGRLGLEWEIVPADPAHYSLSKEPGTLTVTTQDGGISRSSNNCKNLFLIANPARERGDFEITTCIVGFRPLGDWNQAGLICYNDDDNYIKCVCEWSFGGQGPSGD